ncbi:hypothetical protein V2W30_11680 [Streptomyces sp. Q6]|uniref:Uncharacterized protein n=1 Tax=Streptomyces citrinus TaxID=3118173 RepID=A0ACD5A9S0_9ACTN
MTRPLHPLPVLTLDLDADGVLLHPVSGRRVKDKELPHVIRTTLDLPAAVTDVVVFVHGWLTSREKALRGTERLLALAEGGWAARAGRYPALPRHTRVQCVALRWRSVSLYRRARDRTRGNTLEGHAGHVVAALLGYLDEWREPPRPDTADTLPRAGGQYVHAVGHSFGCRFLCQAVPESGPAELSRRPVDVLAPVHEDERYAYTVDSLLLLQMAAPPRVLAAGGAYGRLFTDAPVSGPVAVTHTRHDRATGLWHRLREGERGIGTVGLPGPAAVEVHRTTLRAPERAYADGELHHRLVDVDATEVFRRGRWKPTGAHSDIWYPHTAHLLLSLMNDAHEAARTGGLPANGPNGPVR